jgi:Lipocalin-like domain
MKMRLFDFRTFIPVLIIGLVLSSCSKDSTPEEDIVGTWTTESVSFTAKINGKDMTQFLIDDLGLTATEAQQYTALFSAALQQSFTGTMQIKSDNTYTSTLGGESDSGTWSLSSDGKELTIDSSTEEPTVLDVIELTSGKIHLQGTETQTEDLDDDGTAETIIATVDLIFTK